MQNPCETTKSKKITTHLVIEKRQTRTFIYFTYTPRKTEFYGGYCFQHVRDSEIPSTFNDIAL